MPDKTLGIGGITVGEVIQLLSSLSSECREKCLSGSPGKSNMEARQLWKIHQNMENRRKNQKVRN